MNRSLPFYFVFSVLLFLAGASYFPILEYFEINIDRFLLLTQAIVGVAAVLIALLALDTWRQQDKHKELKSTLLALFDINELFKSLNSIIERASRLENQNFPSDEHTEMLRKGLQKAKREFFLSVLEYKKCWIKAGIENVNELKEIHHEKVKNKTDNLMSLIDDILGENSLNGIVDIQTEYENASKYIHKSLESLIAYYSN